MIIINLKELIQKTKNFKFFKGDIRNKKELLKSFNKVDAVIHLAYVNGTKFFYKNPTLVLDVAIKGLMNVLGKV